VRQLPIKNPIPICSLNRKKPRIEENMSWI
jgi:hypothetical protein